MVTRALAEGKVVLGFGERKTPSPFVNACSKFLFLDQESKNNDTTQANNKNIKSNTKLISLLRQAIEATEEDNGWAELGAVGSHISNKTSFDTRNYGYKNLSSLIKAIDLFELKRGSGNSYLVKDVRKKKTA
jgi:hypothetical protein